MRLLYLTHRLPYPLDKGDRIRNYHVLKFLAGVGEVHLASLDDEGGHSASLARLRRYAATAEVVPVRTASRWVNSAMALFDGRSLSEAAFFSPVLHDLISDIVRREKPDRIVASSSALLPYLLRTGTDPRTWVIDLVDVDSRKWFAYAEATPNPAAKWVYRREGHAVGHLERAVAASGAAVVVVCDREAAAFDEAYHAPRRFVARNGVDFTAFAPRSEEPTGPPRLVFVGALDYKPNVEGISWFAREVWPRIRAGIPKATLNVVGRRPGRGVLALRQIHGINVYGDVLDVRPFLVESTLAVAPVFIARGVQNKVLETLAVGVPAVMTPQVAAGLDAGSKLGLPVAATSDEWVAAVTGLLDDSSRRTELAARGQEYARSERDWAVTLEPFRAALGLPIVNSQLSKGR